MTRFKMKTVKATTILFCFTLYYLNSLAQSPEKSAWLFLTHSQKLSKKFEALVDFQVRTSNKYRHFETLLFRGAGGYKFNKNHSVALGYSFVGDWEKNDEKNSYVPENTIYEQYLLTKKIQQTEVTFRFRQEQRFIRITNNNRFSQRSRWLLSAQIPLAADADFSKGLFTTIQNEILVNTQHKEKVNNSSFDENVAFISLGFRWSKKVETELCYLNRLKREIEGDLLTNVCQLLITTRF